MAKFEQLFQSIPAVGIQALSTEAAKSSAYGIYTGSIQQAGNTVFFLARTGECKVLVLCGSSEYFGQFEGEERAVDDKPYKICGLSHANCLRIRQLFAYTNPVAHGDRPFSMGLGDRLGVASAGHIRAAWDLDVFPILAQQSMRELTLTGRTYPAVLDDAVWAVFQEQYIKGYGADADHLKVQEHIAAALQDGYTMITLDCSDHIENKYFDMSDAQLLACYEQLPAQQRKEIEQRYVGVKFAVGDMTIELSKKALMQNMLIYGKALAFIAKIYSEVISKSGRPLDFEVSIDETTVPTAPESHFFIASEMKNGGIIAQSMAPRFCGEFQKGIDYIGNLADFEKEFVVHSKIADHFGYRLSIHSGSDKFSVFPCIGKYTKLRTHVKTAGTNWLEAVRLIAAHNPSLYRRMHRFALQNLDEAKKYYHIGADPRRIADIDTLPDSALPGLMDDNDARQVLHITYGLMLQEKAPDGGNVFKDDIYATLWQYEAEYYANLIKHIHRHLTMLGFTI